jgi:hypothetical protein
MVGNWALPSFQGSYGLSQFMRLKVSIKDVLLICDPVLFFYNVFHMFFLFLQIFRNMISRCVKGCEGFCYFLVFIFN